MESFEFKVNGESCWAKVQNVDAGELLQIAFNNKAIGEDPNRTGYVLRVSESGQKFKAGDIVNLAEDCVFRAAPEKGAPFA